MNVLLPKYEDPPAYIPPRMVNDYLVKWMNIYNILKLKRKGNPSYDNRLTLFMPRLIYIKKSSLEESVSFQKKFDHFIFLLFY